LFLEEMKKRGVSMKILRRLAFIFILSLLPAYAHSQNLGDLRISLIDGDVQIRTEDTGDWVPASINMPLREDSKTTRISNKEEKGWGNLKSEQDIPS
jgi:hypothetical protein